MADASDDDLLLMYRNGNGAAFDALFDRHHTSVYNFARTVLGNANGPEEILQETFLAVARSAGDYVPRGRFRAWLMRIARNRCLNRLEAERTRKAVLAESGLEILEPVSDEPLPHERIEADEQHRAIRAAIAKLPERQREAVALYASEQMSYREIAETLGVPVNTVKTLLHRARATLARTLDK